MQKKLLIIVACMIAIAAIVGIAVTAHNSEKAEQIEEILQEDSEEEETIALVSLEEVRKGADAVVEAGRNGEYRNLKFNEFCPLITEEDQIYRIKVSIPDVSVTEENLDKVLDMMQTLLEEPIDENLIEVLTTSLEEDEGRITVSELRDRIRNQNKVIIEGGYYLFYLNEEQARCAQINSYMNWRSSL